MSDDTPIQTPDTEVDTTPALTDEAVAAYLSEKVGRPITSAEFDRFKNLDEMAREVMREKSELGRAKKAAAPAAPATADEDVDLDSIDPKTAKLLRAFIQSEFGAALTLPTIQAEDEVSEAIDEFIASHTDVAPEVLGRVIADLESVGAGPKKPTRRATIEFMKVAYNVAKAQTMDVDALKKAAKDEALEELAKEASEKGEVFKVEKKSAAPTVDDDPATGGFWDRLKG